MSRLVWRRAFVAPVLCVLVVFVVALGFRLAMLEWYVPGGPWVANLTLADAEMGRNLVEGRGWWGNRVLLERAVEAQVGQARMVDLQDLLPVDEAPANRVSVGSPHSPGYSLWFALSYLLGGEYRYIYSQRMQAVADSVAAVLVFLIARRAWSTVAGAVGGLLYALSPPHAFLANLTVAASTDSVWFLLAAFGAMVTCDAARHGRPLWRGAALIGVGALCGAAMNSTALVLPTVAAGVTALVSVVDRRYFRAAVAMTLAQVAVVLVLVPWGARNEQMYGQFSLVRGSFWQLAFAAWGELPNPWGLGYDDKEYFHWIDENCRGCDAGERSGAVRNFLIGEVAASQPFARHMYYLLEYRLPRLLEVSLTPPAVLGEGRVAEVLTRIFTHWNTWMPWLGLAALGGLVVAVGIGTSRAAVLVGLAPSLFLMLFSLVFIVEIRKTLPAYGFLLAMTGVAAGAIVSAVLAAGPRVRAAVAVAGVLAIGVSPPQPARAQQLAGGEVHSVAVNQSGQVLTWGNNLFGQLGSAADDSRWGSASTSLAHLAAEGRSVAAGSSHTLAVDHNGAVWAWGDNRWGQLGDGTRTGRRQPTRIAGLTDITSVAGGFVHSLALDGDGRVWAWGSNLYGQLGTPDSAESLSPMPVTIPARVSAIATGWFFSVALDEFGRVWTWGRNDRGQLGTGERENRAAPAQIPKLSGVRSIAAGHLHVVASSASAVHVWGGNDYGQLGQAGAPAPDAVFSLLDSLRSPGQSVGRSGVPTFHPGEPVPRVVHGLPPIEGVAAAADASFAIDISARVWGWGDNLYGQLADGTFQQRASPAVISGLPQVESMAGGHAHLLAVARDGSVWTWGFGHYGQLGDGTSMRRRPVAERVRSVRVREPRIAIDPARDFPIDVGRVDWLDPTFTLLRGTTVDLSGVADEGQRQTYAVVAAPVQAGPESRYKVFYARGIVRRGGVTVGVLVDERWAFSQAMSSPGPFTVIWVPPSDVTANAVLANFLTGDDLTVDVDIEGWGWLTDPDAVESAGVP